MDSLSLGELEGVLIRKNYKNWGTFELRADDRSWGIFEFDIKKELMSQISYLKPRPVLVTLGEIWRRELEILENT